MRRDLLSCCLIAALLVLSACAPEPAAAPAAADPSGSWTGDWGPDRTTATM